MSLSDSKFIPESKILPKLLEETKFLNDSIISENAERIIVACRENKKTRKITFKILKFYAEKKFTSVR